MSKQYQTLKSEQGQIKVVWLVVVATLVILGGVAILLRQHYQPGNQALNPLFDPAQSQTKAGEALVTDEHSAAINSGAATVTPAQPNESKPSRNGDSFHHFWRQLKKDLRIEKVS